MSVDGTSRTRGRDDVDAARRAALVAALAGAAWPVGAVRAGTPASDARFSSGRPGGPLPEGFVRVPFNDRKTPTRWSLVEDGGRTVLEADAKGSVSMVMRAHPVDTRHAPVVSWRWRVLAAPPDADNAVAAREDSAARLLFAFDGDRSKLAWTDRTAMRLARSLSGREMPYATLMYVASDAAPVGTIVPNPHSSRVMMLVASPAAGALGRWQPLSRDLRRDFRDAFGEAPGRLFAWGVMTDSDNTGTEALARYGDVAFGHRSAGRG